MKHGTLIVLGALFLFISILLSDVQTSIEVQKYNAEVGWVLVEKATIMSWHSTLEADQNVKVTPRGVIPMKICRYTEADVIVWIFKSHIVATQSDYIPSTISVVPFWHPCTKPIE